MSSLREAVRKRREAAWVLGRPAEVGRLQEVTVEAARVLGRPAEVGWVLGRPSEIGHVLGSPAEIG